MRRKAYGPPDRGTVHPLDEVLDLPAGLHSPGLARSCVQEAVCGSFTDTADAIEYTAGVRIGTRQIIELSRAAAVDVTAFYTDPDDTLVIIADGKGVPVRGS